MPGQIAGQAPSLGTFLKSYKTQDIDSSIELLISLLKRRQIKNSRSCAIATAQLLRGVVANERWKDTQTLIKRIRSVGRRLIDAQPREIAVGNIVRRVLGVVREVAEQSDHHVGTHGAHPLFGLFQLSASLSDSPTPKGEKKDADKIDIKAEVISGIQELLEELEIVDDQISTYALNHIISGDVILTYGSSQTVQRSLAAAARKRKFTVYHAEAYPNDHAETHSTIVNGGVRHGIDDDEAELWKPLTAAGIQVVIIPDTAVFALMGRVHKVFLAPRAVLKDGSLIAAAGTSTIVQAAKYHRAQVMILSGVYKLSPVTPFAPEGLIEYGDPSKVVPYQDGEFMDKADVINPVYDHVDAEFIDLYISNVGVHALPGLDAIIADHYDREDDDLTAEV